MYDLSHITINALSVTPESEYVARRQRVSKILTDKGLSGMVFFSAASIFYLTGSALTQTERPVVYIYRTDGDSVILVPRLELEHAEEHTKNCKVVCYPEYPGIRHPMEYLKDVVEELKIADSKLGADGAGYPAVSGYHGPTLAELFPKMQLTFLPKMVTQLKIFKSAFEIKLMHESGRWANLAHTLLQEYTKAGMTETEISTRASSEATSTMFRTLGHDYAPCALDGVGVRARYRGQVGKNSYFPHAQPRNLVVNRGDTLVTGTVAYIQGYSCELERVMFVGEPSKEQQKFYKFAVDAQDAAYSMIKPGAKCSDVDKAMMDFYKENNLMDYWRHHTGHSIGSGGHEAPFFDLGDHSVIEPGMCFTVEPGLYVKDLGGFRLSDTLVVTETGFDMVTYYTRDIDKLICDR